MTNLKSLFAAAAVAVATTGSAAFAQTAPDMDMAITAAHNQLGILEYCKNEGHIEDAAIDAQNRVLKMLPAATDTAKVEEGYEKGKAGTVSAMGQEVSLSDAATQQGGSVETMCQQVAAAVEQAAASLPQ